MPGHPTPRAMPRRRAGHTPWLTERPGRGPVSLSGDRRTGYWYAECQSPAAATGNIRVRRLSVSDSDLSQVYPKDKGRQDDEDSLKDCSCLATVSANRSSISALYYDGLTTIHLSPVLLRHHLGHIVALLRLNRCIIESVSMKH
eukprot:61696-Hanusia_phi.AAC.1